MFVGVRTFHVSFGIGIEKVLNFALLSLYFVYSGYSLFNIRVRYDKAIVIV